MPLRRCQEIMSEGGIELDQQNSYGSWLLRVIGSSVASTDAESVWKFMVPLPIAAGCANGRNIARPCLSHITRTTGGASHLLRLYPIAAPSASGTDTPAFSAVYNRNIKNHTTPSFLPPVYSNCQTGPIQTFVSPAATSGVLSNH